MGVRAVLARSLWAVGRISHDMSIGTVRSALALLTLLLPLWLVQPAVAQEVSIEQQVNALMRQGQFADAYALAERSWPASMPNRAMRLEFIRAMSLKAQGRHHEAISVLRRINAENPSFTRVRAELAHALFLVGDHDAAQFHFTDLSRSVDDSRMRDAFEAYLSAMRQKRPYRMGAYVSIAPSTNINGRTTSRTIIVDGIPFELNVDSRARSGIGLSGGVSGERSFLFSNDVRLTVAGRFDGTKYQEAAFDKFQLSGDAFLRKRLGQHTFGAGIIADYQNQGHTSYRDGIGAALEYGRVLEGGRHFFASARLMHNHYPSMGFLDGWQASATLVGRQALGPGHHVTTGLKFAAERTRLNHHDHDDIGVFASHFREWKGGLISQVEPALTLRQYRGRDPAFGIQRRDVEIGGTIRVMHRKLNFGGFSPRFEYSYLRQFSNHPLQERDTHGVNVVLTREF